MTKLFKFTISVVLFTIISGSHARSQGSLVIAGGGLIPGNKNAYTQLVDLAGGPDKSTFAVIPTASGYPVQSFDFVKEILVSYGVKPENVFLIPISLGDDDSTHNVDESTWADNANDPLLAEKVRQCSGVWFTGGDQMQITKAPYTSGGERTPVLQAVWDVFKGGGVIGGTSAGAAIMSEVMIGNGSSLGALTLGIIYDNGPENEETNALLIGRGLGFFPEGIIDQHFNARARLGRLIIALMNSRDRYNLAFGVDENTALIYSASDRRIRVAGKAGVTILNASKAEINYHGKYPEITNLSVSYIEEGDAYLVPSGEVIPAPGKAATRGNEYYHRENPAQGGILSPNGATFLDVITYNLIDNEASDTATNISFNEEGIGFRLTFSKKAESQGYYLENEDEEDLYTVSDVRLDLSPVTVTITEIQK
jgi:cyanophycinase